MSKVGEYYRELEEMGIDPNHIRTLEKQCVECFKPTDNDNRMCDRCQEIVSNMNDFFPPNKKEE